MEESTYTVSESATSLTVDIINNGSIFNGVVEVLLISDRQVSSGKLYIQCMRSPLGHHQLAVTQRWSAYIVEPVYSGHPWDTTS